jgi:hypothetical protein
MLTGRGIVLKSGTPQEIADALHRVADRPEDYREMTRQASAWARQYSLEGLREALRELLNRHWGVTLPGKFVGLKSSAGGQPIGLPLRNQKVLGASRGLPATKMES